MLFNQQDLQLYRLKAWILKFVKNEVQLCDKKFQIPLAIANLYLKFLYENKHRLSNYVILQIGICLETSAESNKVSIEETSENLDCITKEFLQQIKENKIIGTHNEQLVLNIINYILCYLGLRKFNVFLDNDSNEYCVDPKETVVNESLVRCKEDTSKMSNNNVEIKNVIHTVAIIEENPPNPRKRPLPNGSHTPLNSKQKKARSNLDETILIDDDTPANQTNNRIDVDNAIINETKVQLSSKVSVFEDQFKWKINHLAKEYSDLIDVTGVKIKQEDENNSVKVDTNKVKPNTDDTGNYSSDESDVIVLGPAPPKQYDVITLNENGDIIQEKSADSNEAPDAKTGNKEDEVKEESQVEDDNKKQPELQTAASTCLEANKEEEEEEEQRSLCSYPKKWTREMINFYTEDVNPDQFRQNILTQVNRTRPDQWRVDYHNSYRFADVQFNYNKICENCGSRQHDVKNCSKPCFSVCPMCSESGHVPDKCAQSCCLNCGKKTNEYLFNCEDCDQKVVLKIKCDICNRLYHSGDNCPQLWRCMEFTTRKGKLNVIPGGESSNRRKYCSNCAGSGHLIETCPHLSADHPLRQDSSWRVLSKAHAAYTHQYKLKVTRQVSQLLLSKAGIALLQKLSNQSGVHIEYSVDVGVNILTYQANSVQSHFIRSQLKKFLFTS